ncbi:hypothetical protein QVD17_18493 [Tagetes erecta]|uniref:RNase H type-1 domain-containing protein n=1 Tax=Tagetes erecta TaxID=13708 RepID=A0AAD8NW42_TARER|nr:hypothetical protein QVD17_18493 [Tagetes erecta]
MVRWNKGEDGGYIAGKWKRGGRDGGGGKCGDGGDLTPLKKESQIWFANGWLTMRWSIQLSSWDLKIWQLARDPFSYWVVFLVWNVGGYEPVMTKISKFEPDRLKLGAFKSTARSNYATNVDEDHDSKQVPNSFGGNFTSTGAEILVTIVGVTLAGAAWSFSLTPKKTKIETTRRPNVPSLFNPSCTTPERIKQRSVWSPPPLGQFKMNTHGGCRPVPCTGQPSDCVQKGHSGYGGVLRYHRGNRVQGFIGYIGVFDCLTVELHGILKGLEVLDKLKLRGAILETKCQPAYKWITREHWRSYKETKGGHGSPTLDASLCTKTMLLSNCSLEMMGLSKYTCADKPVNMAIDTEQDYVEIQDVPCVLKYVVEQHA